MSKAFQRALGHVRFVAEQGDERGLAAAWAEAVKAAKAEPEGERGAASDGLVELAFELCETLESAAPVRWGLGAAGELGRPLSAKALAQLPDLRRKNDDFEEQRGFDAYAEGIERQAAALDARARAARGDQRGRLRAEAEMLREAGWQVWRAARHPEQLLNRFVPARIAAIARNVVDQGMKRCPDPTDKGCLGGTGGKDDLLSPLDQVDRKVKGDWRPCSLQIAVLLAGLADELADDGREDAARWAAKLGLWYPTWLDTQDPSLGELVAAVIPALAGAARRHRVAGGGALLRGIVQLHHCEGSLPAGVEQQIARVEQELG